MSLKKEIKSLENSETNKIVQKRLEEFSSFSLKDNHEWFQELCFCILAANSKQKTAELIEKSLGFQHLLSMPEKDLSAFIRKNKHRFHNNKARYIAEARKFSNIKEILSSQQDKREWLVKNIKGIGMKEASHFLRNTGTTDLAILDRHIINTLVENDFIERPKTLTTKTYLSIEKKFNALAKELNMSPAKLDLLMWYLKTGEIAK